MSAEKFMGEVGRVLKGDESLDNAYWWFIVYGVLKFKNIGQWWKEEYYKSAVEYSGDKLSRIALMNDLSAQGPQGRSRKRSVRRK